MGLSEWIKLLKPLTEDQKFSLDYLRDEDEYSEVKKLLKLDRVRFDIARAGFSFFVDNEYLQLASDDKILGEFIDGINLKLKRKVGLNWFERFKDTAFETITRMIARNVIGLEGVKKAICLQMFSRENLHILLFNDEGLDSHYFFKSAEMFANKVNCCIGLEVEDGSMLAATDLGIIAIDELNSMKKDYRTFLINAMENGVVVDEHGVKTARIRALAAARPIGGKFSRVYAGLRRQTPIDNYFMNRFNLVFYNRWNDAATKGGGRAVKGVENIKKEDIDFVKSYVEYALGINVHMSMDFEDGIKTYVHMLKAKIVRSVRDIDNRMIGTIEKLAKASARCELRSEVERKDIERAKEILEASLSV